MLVDLAYKPYLRRAWIRQELHFARRVTLLCGDHVALAIHLAELCQTIGESALQNDDIKNLIQLLGSATNSQAIRPIYLFGSCWRHTVIANAAFLMI
jgi:hypothetical protein